MMTGGPGCAGAADSALKRALSTGVSSRLTACLFPTWNQMPVEIDGVLGVIWIGNDASAP
jgi:hypothetical protein